MRKNFRLFSLPDVAFRRAIQILNPLEIIELCFAITDAKHFNKLMRNLYKVEDLKFTGRNFEFQGAGEQRFYVDFSGNADMENETGRLVNGVRFKFWKKTADTIVCIPPNFDESIIAFFDFVVQIFKIEHLTFSIAHSTSSFIDMFLKNVTEKVGFVKVVDVGDTPAALSKMNESSELMKLLRAPSTFFNARITGVDRLEEGSEEKFIDVVDNVIGLRPVFLAVEIDVFKMRAVEILVDYWLLDEKMEEVKALRITSNSGMEVESLDSEFLEKFNAKKLEKNGEEIEVFGSMQNVDNCDVYEVERENGKKALIGFIDSQFFLTGI